VVDLTNNTVTVTPLMVASALPIDSKQVRIRGPLVSVASSSDATTDIGSFNMGVIPFNGTVGGAGQLTIVPTSVTTYEISGAASSGSGGQGQLAGLSTGTLAVAYGALTTADTTTTTTTTVGTATSTGFISSGSSSVTFTATQVLAGSSVQGGGLDCVSGVVAAISGNVLTIEDGTLVAAAGGNAFVGGTTSVIMGSNTLITVLGQAGSEFNTLQQVSVGSFVDAFGVASSQSSTNVILDATAGHVRLDPTTASGLVTVQGSGTLTLNLVQLGGRAVGIFNFTGTGASPGQYVVFTSNLDLANSTVGAPVIVTGLTSSFDTPAPNFTATTLLDPTTIPAELVVDWGTGTAAPFTTYNSSAITLDANNSSIGTRHEIQVGAQTINVVGLASDPQISPDSTVSALYSIGHASRSTIENFDTYAAFITQLQTELNGTTMATGMTAVGQYTASTFIFSAASITLFLND
jgi:hypothetical protein